VNGFLRSMVSLSFFCKMRVALVLFLCLELCGVPTFGGRTGKTVAPDPDDSVADGVDADPLGGVGDDESAASEYVAHSHSRPSSGINCVPSCWNSGRAMKQKIDYEDQDAELDKLWAQEEKEVSCNLEELDEPGPGPSPKARRS
jgi:hypothetical protein